MSRSSFVRTFASDVIPATEQTISLKLYNKLDCYIPNFLSPSPTIVPNQLSLTHLIYRFSRRKSPHPKVYWCFGVRLPIKCHPLLESLNKFRHARWLPQHTQPDIGDLLAKRLQFWNHNDEPKIKKKKREKQFKFGLFHSNHFIICNWSLLISQSI